MKIIVVEDEKKWNEKIVKTINQILIKDNLEIEIISFYDYSKELEKIISKGKLEVLTRTNPRHILENTKIEIELPKPIKERFVK